MLEKASIYVFCQPMLSKSLPSSLFTTSQIVSSITVPHIIFFHSSVELLRKISHYLVANSTNSFLPVCLRQHSKQVGIIHSPCALFPFRGQEDYGRIIFDVHCAKLQNTGGANFFQPALNWKVSLSFPLCHCLGSRGSMSCCLFSCFWRVLSPPSLPRQWWPFIRHIQVSGFACLLSFGKRPSLLFSFQDQVCSSRAAVPCCFFSLLGWWSCN